MAKPGKQGRRRGRPLVELEDVIVQLGDRPQLCGIDWVLAEGEHWIVSGPTGSGKSMLGQALCRQVPIHGGLRYHFDGTRTKGRSYLNRGEVVMVSPEAQRALKGASESYHQARWQSFEGGSSPTVGELLTGESVERISAYDVTPLKTSPGEYARRRERAVEQLGMEHLLERKVIHLSNGESRKLLIARALLQKPRILILDEPLDGLDVQSRSRLRGAIEALTQETSPSLVYLTTRPDGAPAGLNHLLVLEGGRVAETRRFAAPRIVPAVGPSSAAAVDPGAPERLRPVDRGGPGEILIDIWSASVRYGGVEVLSDCDWVVRRGEHWAVVGPNGAGKSTLLSLILGDNPQVYANDVRLFGRRRGSGDSIWELKDRIGWVAPELQVYY
ncbi:MAG: ATP-binding cassette domain-containing protein, partial [Acidobacteriota bacterium]